MLTKLVLRNWQCHGRRTIELSPTVTVLVGETDAGKTSVLRLLKWIALNRPDGDSFISHGQEFARGTLEVDGHKIVRKKGKGENSYSLDGEKYVSFGKGKVPDDISRLLNISPLNFASQLDPPFWFSLTPGEVSRELNSIVNLGRIDDALSNAASAVRSLSVEESLCADRVSAAEERVKGLEWVTEARERLTAIEELRMEAARQNARATRIASLLEGVSGCERDAQRAGEGFLAAKTAYDAGERAVKAREKVKVITDLLDRIDKESTLAAKKLPPDELVEKLTTAVTGAVEKRKWIETAERLLREIRIAKELVCQQERSLAAKEKRYAEATKGVCPVCGKTR